MRRSELPYPFPYQADVYENKLGETFMVFAFNSVLTKRNDIFYTNKELTFISAKKPDGLKEVFFQDIPDESYNTQKFFFCAAIPILVKNDGGEIIERGSKLKLLKKGDMIALNPADEIVDILPYSEFSKKYRFLTKNR